MIRRGFWLTAGAVTGIYGYRRVAAAGRRLSATLTPGRLTPASLAPEGTLELARAGARARVTGRRSESPASTAEASRSHCSTPASTRRCRTCAAASSRAST